MEGAGWDMLIDSRFAGSTLQLEGIPGMSRNPHSGCGIAISLKPPLTLPS